MTGQFDIVIGLDEPRRLARKATEDVAVTEAKRELGTAELGTVISVFPQGSISGRVFVKTASGIHEVRVAKERRS